MNPWGLSTGQASVMRALCSTGSTKGAARALGISPKTVEEQFRRAKEKFGVMPRVVYLLEWDRWDMGRIPNSQESLSEQVAKLEAMVGEVHSLTPNPANQADSLRSPLIGNVRQHCYKGERTMETPKPMEGTWTLTAPNGRAWQADSPLRCMSAEMATRVPATVALARVLAAIDAPDVAERHVQLAEFYGVTNADDLVDRMERHILKLQEKLASAPQWAAGCAPARRVREG